MQVGDCILSPGFSVGEVATVEKVDCSQAGTIVVTHRFQLEGDEYPGDVVVEEQTGAGCPDTTIYTFYPTQDSWEKVDDRLVVCFTAASLAD